MYLVNYAKKGTKFEDKILLIKVNGMNENGIYDQEKYELTREKFKQWFKFLNRECLGPVETILAKEPIYIRSGYYHNNRECYFIKNKRDYSMCDRSHKSYFENFTPCINYYPNGDR